MVWLTNICTRIYTILFYLAFFFRLSQEKQNNLIISFFWLLSIEVKFQSYKYTKLINKNIFFRRDISNISGSSLWNEFCICKISKTVCGQDTKLIWMIHISMRICITGFILVVRHLWFAPVPYKQIILKIS